MSELILASAIVWATSLSLILLIRPQIHIPRHLSRLMVDWQVDGCSVPVVTMSDTVWNYNPLVPAGMLVYISCPHNCLSSYMVLGTGSSRLQDLPALVFRQRRPADTPF